ncbi:MAG: BREX system P-loop protein BrxC, partial [Gammaproteobacteria bacterium]|nr:BREX system P-loop protein BrxC [Gammaproteobacteria bacterium]
EQALDEVLNIITLLASRNRQIILHNLVEERFGRLPYGWPDWEVILLIARLVMKGEISLAMDGATLAADKIFDTIKTPNKWRGITIEKRKSVDGHLLQRARKLAKDTFGRIAPDGEDKLAASLRESLSQWKENLGQYQVLAQTGEYPGSAEIAAGLGVINKLLAETTSFELINRFLERENDLLDLTEEIHDLDNFYSSQRVTWDRLRTALRRFQPNRKWLERDKAADKALEQMQAILDSNSPYSRIKAIAGLIRSVTEINETQVFKVRGIALKGIDSMVQQVTVELGNVNASPELRNTCLYPLQSLRKQIEAQTSIAHLFQTKEEARELADTALGRIEAAATPKPYPLSEDRPIPAHGANEEQPTTSQVATPKPIKARKVIKPSELVPKTYLETQADVDDYLTRLKQELEAALAANARIEIR